MYWYWHRFSEPHTNHCYYMALLDNRNHSLSWCQFINHHFSRVLTLTSVRLGSRVVSVLDSGAEGPGFKSQSRRCRVTVLGKLFTHNCASVHQAAKLVAALLRVAGVTAGLAESNGGLTSGLWLTSPAGWLPRTRISSGTLRSVIEYGLLLPFLALTGFYYLQLYGTE